MKSKPNRFPGILNLIFLVISPAMYAKISIQDFAPKPPLGFNSFDSYRSCLSEDKAIALMDVMAEKYLPFGYEYFVKDAGWCSNGVMGVNVYRAGNIDVWLTPHKLDPRMGRIGIFNRSKTNRKVTLTKQDLGFVAFEASYNLTAARQAYRLKGIWSDETIITKINTHSPSRQRVLYSSRFKCNESGRNEQCYCVKARPYMDSVLVILDSIAV